MPRISSKYQVTLPVESLAAAGLKAGDDVSIEADGPDTIVVRRAPRDVDRALGIFDGLYEPGYLDRLLQRRACVSACVLDTDVVIAALDRADAHHRSAARALTRMVQAEVPLLLSLINYAEALVRPAEQAPALRAAVSAIDALGIRLIAPTPAIARDAARLRGANISLADGFALATARAHDATVASFDRRVRPALRSAGTKLEPAFR